MTITGLKTTSKIVLDYLDELFPDANCELLYDKDYELLIAVVLSAQCTDKRVNEVTRVLFSKYDLNGLSKCSIREIEAIIRPVGTYTRKAYYIQEIARKLVLEKEGKVPNDRSYLESLPGVGRKTCNVVLSNLFGENAIAVDTHVARVSKRLGFAKDCDDVSVIEKKLMRIFPKEKWSRAHHQLVLFGRYHCKARNPLCVSCALKEYCKAYKKRT